ncbi:MULTISPECIES: hypothetical protein [Aerococcus]|uniref:hypothetical protein n=1 Tax=Aerococcus TaxID=1375 RepID=UPI0018A73C64|nr:MULTISPECIES: hypothetical protein [Aerococcus]MCY3035333.1 hypothetical protein [Aerococcus sp. Group 2]MCY3038756.1 hypothetical protein [Aerococcus sp. Group 2]MCY3040911.1 hypothetical protein [Aerococcus sp. Group 2]MCY3042149.1 hypothetical protein [Aerococcus sp. Group 2]MDK6520530.1 hypothetical protein [Aerococcus urinae]
MKRRDYRQAKKAYEKEKQNQTKGDNEVKDPLYNQATTEFNSDDFRDLSFDDQELHDQDTNEIFFEKQKRRQWQWSSPNKGASRFIVLLLAILAIIVAVLVMPILVNFFRQVVTFI